MTATVRIPSSTMSTDLGGRHRISMDAPLWHTSWHTGAPASAGGGRRAGDTTEGRTSAARPSAPSDLIWASWRASAPDGRAHHVYDVGESLEPQPSDQQADTPPSGRGGPGNVEQQRPDAVDVGPEAVPERVGQGLGDLLGAPPGSLLQRQHLRQRMSAGRLALTTRPRATRATTHLRRRVRSGRRCRSTPPRP